MIGRICTLAVVLASTLLSYPVSAESAKASSWVGRVVVTPQGELLGRIEDLAVDLENKRVDFVVVSVGSFLIDDNLIAVDPDAIGMSEDGRYLVVQADDLDSARRFSADSWPQSADVMASDSREAVAVSEVAAADEDAGFDGGRVATISDGRRTATMKGGERQIEMTSSARAPAKEDTSKVQPKRFQGGSADGALLADSEFEKLDENSDGYLSRSEIGVRLNSNINYSDYDLDSNDGIDAFEFQIMKERG